MTKEELELYRKCIRKVSKKKRLTYREYEQEHEYDNETNNSDYERE